MARALGVRLVMTSRFLAGVGSAGGGADAQDAGRLVAATTATISNQRLMPRT